MVPVESNKNFSVNNVLSFRKKITQDQANEEMKKIAKFLESQDIKQSGPVITATFDVDTDNGDPLMDMEILIPMDRKIDLPEDYRFKEIFHIAHAVCAKHSGAPSSLHSTYTDLFTYLKNNNLQPITAVYNAYVKGLSSGSPEDDMNIDVYIGVNPSTL